MELNIEHIKKALECHHKNEKENTCEYCAECPASKYDLCEGVITDDCADEMFTASLVLINELTDEVNTLKDTLCKRNAEIYRLQREMEKK